MSEQSPILERAAGLMADEHFRLTSLGLPSAAVSAGLERARGTATFRTKPLSADIRDRAFLEILVHEISKVEAWCKGTLAYFDE